MAKPSFDAKSTLRFDLGRGIVTHKSAARQVLLPVEALQALLSSAGEGAAKQLGEQLGAAIGAALVSAFGSTGQVGDASLAELTEGLLLELSVRGLGQASIEGYGDALVVRIDQPALDAPALWEALVATALRTATETTLAAVRVESSPLRLLLTSFGTAQRARALVGEGVGNVPALLSKLSAAT